MTDPGREVRSRRACVLAAMVLAGLLPVGCSGGWFSPFDTRVTRPSELYAFLQSPRQHVTGVSVNGHRLQIGKRPSLQVLPGYGRPMFQVRPKGRIQSKYRSLTDCEVMDLCSNVTGPGLDSLRTLVNSGRGPRPSWEGTVRGRRVAVFRAGSFTYLVTGLAEKPLFMGQVELAARLGMPDAAVLANVVPAQDRWLGRFRDAPAFEKDYPSSFVSTETDPLVDWLRRNHPST